MCSMDKLGAERPCVSIIVPVYNMEPYLSRCLESLVSQRLENIEIIAVNDGSTDSSFEILNQYAKRDVRIKVVHRPNGGVSSARNEGMAHARGQYVGFVDPDDWIDIEMYAELYTTALLDDADIVMCTYVREFGTHSKKKDFHMPSKMIYTGEEVKKCILRRMIGPIDDEVAFPENLDSWGTIWSKIYRADLLQKNKIQFIDLNIIGSNEDSLFNIMAVNHCRSFVYLDNPYYHYWRANQDSITSRYNPRLPQQFANLYDILRNFITENQLGNEYGLALNNRICMNVLGLGLNIINRHHQKSMLHKIISIHQILKKPHIQKSLQAMELKHHSIAWKLFFLCAKIRFSVGLYLLLAVVERMRLRGGKRKLNGSNASIAGRHRDEPGRA